MIIVLIHWRIKDSNEAVLQFLRWWRNNGRINDKRDLVGEFLSEPMPGDQFPFQVDDLSHKVGQERYRPFVNVGIWNDWESFHEQVGKNFTDDKPLLPFETTRRSRTILEPKEWRKGEAGLPNESTCD